MDEMELYIHIPFCMRKCDYCDFLSGVYSESVQKKYAEAVIIELKVMAASFSNVSISSVYFGGGTPSWLDEQLLCDIMAAVRANYRLTKDCEISIECNPGTMNPYKVDRYLGAGINRISIGLQSANDDELYMLGRVHTFDQFLSTYEAVMNGGFRDINVDIMTGLPYQNLAKLENTLKEVTCLQPTHISAYNLIIEEGTKYFDRYEADAIAQANGEPTEYLPDEELNYALYKYTQEYLAKRGYKRYEISNYCKDGAKCRHNTGYWNRVPYLGVGIGAASLIDDHRTKNVTDIYKYIEIADKIATEPDYIRRSKRQKASEDGAVVWDIFSPFWDEDILLSRFDAMAEFMYLGLRQLDGVTRENFQNMFGQQIESIYGSVITGLKSQGLLEATEGRIWLTDLGLDVSNQVLAKFIIS